MDPEKKIKQLDHIRVRIRTIRSRNIQYLRAFVPRPGQTETDSMGGIELARIVKRAVEGDQEIWQDWLALVKRIQIDIVMGIEGVDTVRLYETKPGENIPNANLEGDFDL